eukprot:m.200953 g.200953  ORF g.200953 m.200953 type:complete len:268 (+) comp10670_c0_seq1:1942-2745(+)
MAAPRDAFARQAAVPGWNDAVLAQQTALVLGVGGIGSTTAMALARLGIRRIVLVDCDVVEASNLNRQVLFSAADVGHPKTAAAAAGLAVHTIRTEVISLQLDALSEWARVVEASEEATVIFNAIDHGQYFDVAAAALALARRIPYLSASSYGHTAIIEAFSAPGAPCWNCNNQPPNAEVVAQLAPSKILSLSSLDMLTSLADDRPSTGEVGSSVLPCSLASQLMVTAWTNSLFDGAAPHWAMLNLLDMSLDKFDVERNEACLLCSSS